MDYLKGRGAQIKTGNRFMKNEYVTEHIEGLDEEMASALTTQIFSGHAKKNCQQSGQPRPRHDVLHESVSGL